MLKPPDVTSIAARLARLARVLAHDPAEGFDRIRTSFEIRAHGRSDETHPKYEADPRWDEKLHALLGAPWPCAESRDFEQVWSELASSLDADGLQLGLAGHDAKRAFARAAWCVTRHARPENVVETGVARGVTTRFVLEALERNGRGHLWSIDLPDLEGEAATRIGSAVPETLRRHRWTYMRGASRRLLPKTIARLGRIEVFIHDSLHSRRNMLFEMETVWPALTEGAVLIADDVGMNTAFGEFGADVSAPSLVARKDDGEDLFGVIVKTKSPVPARAPT